MVQEPLERKEEGRKGATLKKRKASRKSLLAEGSSTSLIISVLNMAGTAVNRWRNVPGDGWGSVWGGEKRPSPMAWLNENAVGGKRLCLHPLSGN